MVHQFESVGCNYSNMPLCHQIFSILLKLWHESVITFVLCGKQKLHFFQKTLCNILWNESLYKYQIKPQKSSISVCITLQQFIEIHKKYLKYFQHISTANLWYLLKITVYHIPLIKCICVNVCTLNKVTYIYSKCKAISRVVEFISPEKRPHLQNVFKIQITSILLCMTNNGSIENIDLLFVSLMDRAVTGIIWTFHCYQD